MESHKVWHFMEEFSKALTSHLRKDYDKWGDTWLNRTRRGQEVRTIHSLRDKFDKYIYAGQPIDWLAVAGEAMIAWIRENHKEIFPE